MEVKGYAALIGDLKGSKASTPRHRLQLTLRSALELTNRRVAALQPLDITIGDEFQGMYATLEAALAATLLVQLGLGGGRRARVGIGTGGLSFYEPGQAPFQQDGPAWWAAREAVEAARDATPPLLTAYRHWGDHPPASVNPWVQPTLPGFEEGLPRPVEIVGNIEALINGLLVRSDEVMSELDERDCRIILAIVDGVSQRSISESEGITQPAVSQRLKRSGGTAIARSIEWLAGSVT